MVYTIFLGKQGKRVYTIGPERRVYTIEPQTRKKKKRGFSTVVVYTFFFPVFRPFWDFPDFSGFSPCVLGFSPDSSFFSVY